MESTPYVLFPNCVINLVTTGWIFDISLCENSINQSIKKAYKYVSVDRALLWQVGARSLRSTTADDRGDPLIPRCDESLRAE